MARRSAQSLARDTQTCRKDANSDDDAAKTESQQILALRPLLKKPQTDHKEVQQLRVKVAADQKQIKALLEQRTRQAKEEETRRRSEIAQTILEALKAPNQHVRGEIPVYTGTKIAGNAVYALVTDTLTASEGLIKEYQRLDNMITDMQNDRTEPITVTWKKDIDETERQLKMGARVALRNVRKVLGADVEEDELGMTEEDGDDVMNGFEGIKENELNFGLQKSLRYAERGVKRMVKGLPNDESF